MRHKHVWIFGICIALIMGSMYIPASAQEEVTEISFTIGSGDITIDGKTMKVEPSYEENGATLVPLRVISEAFGAQVDWDGATESVSIRLDDDTILLTIDDKNCYVNNDKKTLITAPALKNSTTMVPLRFISETLGADVHYDGQTNSVLVRYTPALTGTVLQLPNFGVQVTMPEGWTQKTTGNGRLLMEKRYSGGTGDFVYIMAAQASCSGEEWQKQETEFLKSQYGKDKFEAKSGQMTDENGGWVTLDVTVTYPKWKTLLKERYLRGQDTGYFVRYGRLEPSPQDGEEENAAEPAEEKPSENLAQPGNTPAWEEMEQILKTLHITLKDVETVNAADPHWNATQRILNKYDGWQMDIPESFQTVKSYEGFSLYEQQPDGIRLAMVAATKQYSSMGKFENVLTFRVSKILTDGEGFLKREYKDYYEGFANYTMNRLKQDGNYVHTEEITLPRNREKETIGNSGYKLASLCFQKDTVRYYTMNYFFNGHSAAGNGAKFLGQILMPEQTGNWLDMDRIYQLMRTFRYAR